MNSDPAVDMGRRSSEEDRRQCTVHLRTREVQQTPSPSKCSWYCWCLPCMCKECGFVEIRCRSNQAKGQLLLFDSAVCEPISGMLKDQISGLFVQAPVHPGSFIDSFINENVASAARKRSERRSVAQAMATIATSVDDAGSVTEATGW